MRPLRSHITYANVVATLALLLAISGGAAYAAGKLGTKDIAPSAITSKQIRDETIVSRDVRDGGLAGADLARGAVGAGHLATAAVGPDALADDAVGADALADGSVGADALADGSVASATIADAGVESHDLAPGAATNPAIADGAVDRAKLARGAVGRDQIDQGQVQERMTFGAIRSDGSIRMATGNVAQVTHPAPGVYCIKASGISQLEAESLVASVHAEGLPAMAGTAGGVGNNEGCEWDLSVVLENPAGQRVNARFTFMVAGS